MGLRDDMYIQNKIDDCLEKISDDLNEIEANYGICIDVNYKWDYVDGDF